VDSGQWTVDNGQWTMDSGQWTMDNGQWTMDSGQWTVDNGQWTVDNGQWTVDNGQWTEDNGQWTEDSGQWTVDSEDWITVHPPPESTAWVMLRHDFRPHIRFSPVAMSSTSYTWAESNSTQRRIATLHYDISTLLAISHRHIGADHWPIFSSPARRK
jgi:hypothetical protein